MQYITAEQFMELPEESQKTLKEWIQDNYTKGDLVATQHGGIETVIIFDKFKDENKREGYYCITQHGKTPMWLAEYKEWLIPLFTEGQLRQFIEDKTGKVTRTGMTICRDRFIEIEGEIFTSIRREEIIDKDLLQAYWKYACRLAKEGIQHDNSI